MSTLRVGHRHRYLDHYPSNGRRIWYLALAIIATIILYYQVLVLPSIRDSVFSAFHIPFTTYALILIVNNVLGAIAALLGSLADRLGRRNLVVYGLLATSVVTFGVALTNSSATFFLGIFLLAFIDGMMLVVTPSLVRDFSPRLGRALALAFWSIGVVGGNFLATFVASRTLAAYHNAWQSQYVIAGSIGLLVFLLIFFFLRDLSPGLRDQIMHSSKEKALVESRAARIDVDKAMAHPWKQMLRLRLVITALGFALYSLIYFAASYFFPTYLQSVFHLSNAEATGLASIFWLVNVVTAILAGFLSDFTRVRKPFLLVGSIVLATVMFFFIGRVGVPTGSGLMAVFMGLFGFAIGIGSAPWYAVYTEMVEDINPALVATGLSIQSLILRVFLILSFLGFAVVVKNQLNGSQWSIWWWICLAGQVAFLLTLPLISGYWNPVNARKSASQEEQRPDTVAEAI